MNIKTEVSQFNEKFPVGTKVRVLGLKQEPTIESEIAALAKINFGFGMVLVKGHEMPVNISRIVKSEARA